MVDGLLQHQQATHRHSDEVEEQSQDEGGFKTQKSPSSHRLLLAEEKQNTLKDLLHCAHASVVSIGLRGKTRRSGFGTCSNLCIRASYKERSQLLIRKEG